MNALPESGVPFGKYLLIRRLAIGGMAEIWLARPIDGAGKPIVLKRILPQFASDPEFTSRFREEASLTLQLVHGNIVPVFEIGSVGEEPYIAMEHVPGYDLRSVLKRSRDKGVTSPVGVAAYVGAELLRGLEYAHRKMDGSGRVLNLVHRDVSPSNVVVSWEGTVKLLDFGIAKAIGRAEATRTGVLRGKVGYMSPEQARGEAIGPASDLFSTGVVLYELLTATRLFDGDSEPEVLERVKSATIAPIREKNREVPEELERVISKALTRDVHTRYANATEFLAALNKFIVNSGVAADASVTTEFLKKLFPEDTVAEEFDARTATHGVSTASPGMHRLSPIALQLGGGIAATPPPANGSLGATAPVPRWPLYAGGAALAVALALTGAAVNGNLSSTPAVAAKAPGALYVNSIPAGARVHIDGEDTGRVTPDQFDGLPPGPHDVEVVLPDHGTWTDRPVVASGNTKVLTAKLVADLRELRVTTDPPGATVALTGGGRCDAPCSFPGLKPSQTAELSATRKGFRKLVARVRVGDVTGSSAGPFAMKLEPEGKPAATAIALASPLAATPVPTIAEPPIEVSFRILPYGRFSIDGGANRENSARDVPLTRGKHQVHLTNESLGVDAMCEVTVPGPDDGPIKIDITDGKLPATCKPR